MQIQKINTQMPSKNEALQKRKNNQPSFSGDFVFLEMGLGQKLSKHPELRKIIDSFQNFIEKGTDNNLGVAVSYMPKGEAKPVTAKITENRFETAYEDLKIQYHDYKTNEIKTTGFYLNPHENENTNCANLWQNLIDHAKDNIKWEKIFNIK